MSKRWIIVSNRLPVEYDAAAKKMKPGSGGLVSALSNIKSKTEMIWVGTAPGTSGNVEFGKGLSPVRVSNELYDQYYNGMSNDVLWPLFHYQSDSVRFDWQNWRAYKKVNQIFADHILKIARPTDLIWVHDFHLFLLPRMLKEKKPRLRVGFFLHIPFPSSEIYRQLPVRKQIIEGIVRADLIGFHDYSYLRHFITSTRAMLDVSDSILSLRYQGHEAQLGVFPVSIDTGKFEKTTRSAGVQKFIKEHKSRKNYEKLILGVDRLDYIKGIDLKLRAFREALRQNPSWRKKVSLMQIAVPSRTGVPEYMRLKNEIDQLVGEINGEFGGSAYVPVLYRFSSVPFSELVALYRIADVLFVTSKRDGMNLVSFEYVAAQPRNNPGVVVLSEFAGAVATLSHVQAINPWDTYETAQSLKQALEMPKEERIEKHRPMISYLERYTATEWAEYFLSRLEGSYTAHIHSAQPINYTKDKKLSPPMRIKRRLSNRKRLFFLDYDGTLAPIVNNPEDAVMAAQTRRAVETLAKKYQVVIISGRDSKFLRRQFVDMKVSMAFEHGAKFLEMGKKKVQSLVRTDINLWYQAAFRMMTDYSFRVPGSRVEQKEYAVAWHYRNSPSDFAEYQARKLKAELEGSLSNFPVSIMEGKKVIEARAMESNKGSFLRWYLNTFEIHHETLVTAIGDDITDEQMFEALDSSGISIKVGEESTQADFRIKEQAMINDLLRALAQ